MTPFLSARRVIPDMLTTLAVLATLSMPVVGAECWIPLPNQPDSYTPLDAGSIQHMPNGSVSAWMRVEASSRMGTRSLQCMFGVFRGDMIDFLYTADCRSQQFSVSQAKLYQDTLTISERQIVNDAGWQRVDGIGLTGEVAHQFCGG